MTISPRRLGFALVLAASAALVAGCAQNTEAAPGPSGSRAPQPDASASAPAETPSTQPTDVAPECETIIPESTVADFESVGWSSEKSSFYIGELELTEGLMCVWADFDAPAGDHLQLFGWAPITASEAEEAQASLTGQGWLREEALEGVYITENPETTISVDDEGYGMTYLFSGDTVELADTKQGLLLVEWPKR